MALVGGKIQIRTIYHLHLHSQKKKISLIPDAASERVYDADEHLKYSDYRADGIGDIFFFRLSNQVRLQPRLPLLASVSQPYNSEFNGKVARFLIY